jgi:hypothetical protein
MNTTNRYYTRWLAGFVMAAGLGSAIFSGGAVASADAGTPANTDVSVGPVNDGQDGGVTTRTINPDIFMYPVPQRSPRYANFHEEVGVKKPTNPPTQPTQPK